MQIKTYKLSGSIPVLLLAVVFAAVSFGCQPLKKKFTRQKKTDAEDIIEPVLDPIDYAPISASPKARYSHHYTLWWVYHKDLAGAIHFEESPKHLSYIVEQCINQLIEMKEYLKEERKADLQEIIDRYSLYREEIAERGPKSHRRAVQGKIEQLVKQIKKEYNPKNFVSAEDMP